MTAQGVAITSGAIPDEPWRPRYEPGARRRMSPPIEQAEAALAIAPHERPVGRAIELVGLVGLQMPVMVRRVRFVGEPADLVDNALDAVDAVNELVCAHCSV